MLRQLQPRALDAPKAWLYLCPQDRIEAIYQELQALPEKIREAGERVKQWEYKRELFSAPRRSGQGLEAAARAGPKRWRRI